MQPFLLGLTIKITHKLRLANLKKCVYLGLIYTDYFSLKISDYADNVILLAKYKKPDMNYNAAFNGIFCGLAFVANWSEAEATKGGAQKKSVATPCYIRH